jgi:hypothetical protein
MKADFIILTAKAVQNHEIGYFSPSSETEKGAGG